MKISQKKFKKAPVRASRYTRPARAIKAEDEIVDETEGGAAEADVVVDPEATDLLFEVEDVAELVAEVTGQEVEVTADENQVTFAVGEDSFIVEAEGDEEILESSTRVLKGKKTVKASTRRPARKPAPRRR